MNDSGSSGSDFGSIFEQVELLCAQFEQEWRDGKRPFIEDKLQEIVPEARGSLFRNLLQIELRARRHKADDPAESDYERFCPEFEEEIQRQFARSTVGDEALTGDTEEDAPTGDAIPTGADEPSTIDRQSREERRQLGSYVLLGRLGEGAMGVVYRARHVERGDIVALKVLDIDDIRDNPARLSDFKREFRSIADISHPNLVGLHDLHEEEGVCFFTMDLVDGVDFKSYVRPHNQLDEQRLRSALVQLVRAVAAIHQHQQMHRDLKPSNMLVTGDGRLVVLDFGLARNLSSSRQATETGAFRGTFHYAAPEQFNSQPSEKSDWYAVGTILYESLAGRLPYRAKGAVEWMQIKQSEDPPPFPAGLPTDLCKLARNLLERDPNDRPTVAQLQEMLGEEDNQLVSATEALPIIGREKQLQQLNDSFAAMRHNNELRTIFVQGRSGEGKSFLIERFLQPHRENPNVTVLGGRCYDRESVPYKALDSLIDELASNLRSRGREAEGLLPDDISFLAHLFPSLQRVEAIHRMYDERVGRMSEQQVRQRAAGALRNLLQRMVRTSELAAVILYIDDLQWGDADSANLLFDVLQPPLSPTVLLLGSFRSDEAADSDFLESWQALQDGEDESLIKDDVIVEPFSFEQCIQLAQSLHGDTGDMQDRANAILEQTAGNPYLLSELFENSANVEVSASRALKDVIDRKLEQLPQHARQILDVVAVSGQAIDVREIAGASGLQSVDSSTLVHMRNEKLLKEIQSESGHLIDTYHDKVRETVLAAMPVEHRTSQHLLLLRTIEQLVHFDVDQGLKLIAEGEGASASGQVTTRLFDLTLHSDSSGDRRRAAVYGLLAAEQAKRQYSFETAREYFEIVERNREGANDLIRFRKGVGVGHALMMLARYDDAQAEVRAVVELGETELAKARAEELLGEILSRMGRITESIAVLSRGLGRQGVKVPQSVVGFVFATMVTLGKRFMRWLTRKRLYSQQPTHKTDVIERSLAHLQQAFFFNNMLKVVWGNFYLMTHAEMRRPSGPLISAYGIHTAAMVVFGYRSRARRIGEVAVELSQEIDDQEALAIINSYIAAGYYGSAKFDDAIDQLVVANQLTEKVNDHFYKNLTTFHLASCYYRKGDFVEATKWARETFQSSCRFSDSRSHCSLMAWSRSAHGCIPFTELASQFRPNPDEVMPYCNYLIGQGCWELFQGKRAEAIETLTRSWSIAKKSVQVTFHTVGAYMWLATALRNQANSLAESDPQQARSLRRRSLKISKRAAWWGKFYVNDYPHALRELALSLELNGRTRAALKYAAKSQRVAEQQGARYEEALSAKVVARLRKTLNKPDADAQFAEADAKLAEFGETLKEVTQSEDAAKMMAYLT